jgi:2-alkenal reductase
MKTIPALVFAAALGCMSAAALVPPAHAREAAQPRPITPRGPLGASEQAVVRLFQEAAPSVAYINTERVALNGFFMTQVYRGAGSGFVWDERGHVVTNYHVVEDARSVRVQLGSHTYDAQVIGIAPDYDLAVVKLARPPKGLKPIRLGTSSDLKIGQSVYAIGNPFGLARTLTTGIVSALDRHLPTTQVLEVSGVIQTDAAINPGNSGGPLLDSAGRLIGVTSAIKSPVGASSGVGLAIPVDLVNRIVPQLIAHGRAALPGIGIVPVDPDLVASAGIQGVVIARVQAGSPAARAGLRPLDARSGDLGDVIVAVDGHPVTTLAEFGAELDRAGIDHDAELTVVRDGKERRLRVKIVAVQR